jgi:molybdate transport system ATP-binding protein
MEPHMSLMLSLELKRPQFTLSVHTTLETHGCTAIYGPSGAGKTTLLRWLAGLETEAKGQLTFNHEVWQDDNHFVPAQHRKISYVFQEPRLFPHLSIQGNLDFAYKRRFNNDGPTMAQVCQWFEIEHLLHKNPEQLSGGEQQRVAISRALLSSPQLIFMDEPLASLDKNSKIRILYFLEQMQKNTPIPILYVSHDFEEVSRLANQLLLLENGQISAQDSLLEISHRLDLNLSHEENAASIIDASIVRHDEKYQLTELLIDNQLSLLISKVDGTEGEHVRIRVPARDVSITLKRSEDSSILNILPATIEEIEDINNSSLNARALIKLRLAHQYILVRLTHKSIDRLQLKMGQHVFAQIKTVALLNEKQLGEKIVSRNSINA